MATDTLALENIEEFVHDENKIVTCKWLSLTLKIHVNQAKKLLFTFLTQQRTKDKDVNATYFLAGQRRAEDGQVVHQAQVVGEEDLAAAKGRLSTVTSCHVYSIQRANLKDSNLLYMIDYDAVRENRAECNKFSSIHCEKASIARVMKGVRQPLDEKPPVKKEQQERKESVKEGDKGAATIPVGGTAKGKKANDKGAIAAMFGAQNAKKPDTAANKKKEVPEKKDTTESKPAPKKGGVMAMFANAKPAAPKPKAAEPEKEKPAPAPKEKERSKKAVKESSTKASSKSKKKPRPSEDSDEEEQSHKKKRRRIKNDPFDSSSEEEMIDVGGESPPPSPVREESPVREASPAVLAPDTSEEKEEEKAASSSAANGGKARRRKRKLVPKTYLDEDGFMVTEKVWESDSTDASEVEQEPKPKEAPQKKSEPQPKKKSSPQKKKSPAAANTGNKQASIMSFFKKN